MFNEFYIKKKSGTYSETLEAFGVANLLDEILKRNNVSGYKITLADCGESYVVKTNKAILEEYIHKLTYFQVVKYIKREIYQEMPDGIVDYYDYPKNKAIQDDYVERFAEITKIKSDETRKQASKALTEDKLSEFGKKIDPEYNVYRELSSNNPYPSFKKLFDNFHLNQNRFSEMINLIVTFYAQQVLISLDFPLSETKPTAQQLLNPNQGKGLNKSKANNASMGNLDGLWISETMKLSGAFSFMICQFTKVGSGSDLKIYVPEFNEIGLREAERLTFSFKKYLRRTTPIKLDIINDFDFAINFIENTPGYIGRLSKTIKGFHSVYQKKLGGPTKPGTVTNITFINTPDFIEYANKDEGAEWIEILQQQRSLISNIEEQGDSIQGLQNYRSFIGSVGNSALEYFSQFSFWYSGYLMQKLTKGNKFIKTFKIDHLTKFYKNMDTKELMLSVIIQDEGFKAVAQAIRKSTVSLQYTPKDQRKFEIRYGLAQQLQNKAKSKEDLATFIGEFIGTYNAETARNAEKNGGKSIRANVKDEEQFRFYSLLDDHPARLIGALLASYGFALNKRETNVDDLATEAIIENEN